jgi:hypothetical protein
MEYKTKEQGNEFLDMVKYVKDQYLRTKSKVKRFEDTSMYDLTGVGKMLLYS